MIRNEYSNGLLLLKSCERLKAPLASYLNVEKKESASLESCLSNASYLYSQTMIACAR